MIKVLIADDHVIVREGLKRIISDIPDIKVTAEAGDGNQLLNLLRSELIDVVLLDISMPGRNGLEILKLVKAQKPRLPILILSIYPEEQYAKRALMLGASGYLNKEAAPSLLISAIRKVADGGNYINPNLTDKLLGELLKGDQLKPHESLSNRELQILLMMASGLSPTKIAEHLRISVKTVSTYRSRILDKMMMESNAELITYAIKNNLGEYL